MSSRVSSQNNLAPQSTFSRGKSRVLAEGPVTGCDGGCKDIFY